MKQRSQVLTIIIALVIGIPTAAAPSFTDNGDGTISDTANHLVWQKCLRGQTSDATCSGSATTANWDTALGYCNSLSLAGRSWRLPNVNELKSIVDYTTSNPSIDATKFPSTVAHNYWSATTSVGDTTKAWIVAFATGYVESYSKASSCYVRCVSSGP
ncbi:MAG: DUF1566 domain-containing protein [Leptospiraceae bacterium]|nr:DUF1566 domain-containing protein [Leptospiraceae bacterium]